MEETTAQKVEAKGQLESAWIDGALEAVMKIILNSRETQHNHRVFVNSLSRYKTFEEELAKKSGRRVQVVASGSVAENLFAIHWVYKDGRREANNDIDVMLVDCSMVVTEKDSDVKAKDTERKRDKSVHLGSSKLSLAEDESHSQVILEGKLTQFEKIIFLVPSKHPGYVQLCKVDEEGKTHFLTSENFKAFWAEVVNNTALYSLVSGPQLPVGGVIMSGPALTRRDRPGSRNNFSHDYVPCLHCPQWTTLADKWADRKRAADWPSKDLISEIVSEGCHVVPVFFHGIDSSLNPTEWRLSFSQAEKKLIHSLATEQRQSYVMAKLIIKQVIKKMKADSLSTSSVEKTPSSYHLKTIFLWKCEEKTLEKWKNFLESVTDLLKTFADHLRKGNIPQYFVPENNLIGHMKTIVLCSVADGITAAVSSLFTVLHNVFLTAYDSQFDYDGGVCPIRRLLNCQLNSLCTTGIAEDKLYLLCIMNFLLDSLSAATVATSDELQPLEDHKYFLGIYRSCKSAVTLPSPPVLGAAEVETTTLLLFEYLLNLLQNTHVLAVLKTDIFSILTRLFTQNLVSLSVKEIFTKCCEESLKVYQTVSEALSISCYSDISCREELGALKGIDFIFFKHPDMAKKEFCQFASKRYRNFQENGELSRVKSLSW